MTGLEWIIALGIIWWVLRGVGADLRVVMRGRTPGRVSAGRARAAAGGGRYGLRSYLGDLWSDAWMVARAKREARMAQRLEHIREHGPGPTWRQRAGERWSAAWSRWEARMADRWQDRRARDGQRPAPEPVAPAAPAGGGPTERGPEGQQRPQTGDDPGSPGGGPTERGPEGQQRPQTGDDPGSPGGGPTERGPEGQQRPQTGDDPGSPGGGRPGPPRRGDQNDAARPGQFGPELTARPTGDGRWVVDPDPHRAGETSRERRDDDMAEVTGLASALAHATEMRKAHEESTAGAEQYAASLAAGGVTGEALAAVQQAMEAQQQAAAAWGQAEATLSRHMQVKEAYEANQDAGSKEFVTAE